MNARLRLATSFLPLALLAGCAATGAPAGAAARADDAAARNARIAFPTGGAPVELTFFAGDLSDDERAQIAAAAPNVRIVTGLSRADALARAGEAHGADARFATPEFLARATKLVWVQAMSAGVERYLRIAPLAENDAIVLTNQQGAGGPAIADHTFAMLLALTRDLRPFLEHQSEGRWSRTGSDAGAIALEGRTLLVVGLGGIGTEIARRGAGFGMRVLATRRSDAPGPAYVERVGRPDDLLSLLPEADVVAIAAPLTPETEGLFDARAFAAMRRGAFLVNVARGRIVDTDALVAALREGRLGGACLDVTDPEPLPAGHPLWSFRNVVVTPHVAGRAELSGTRAFAVLKENLRRFGAGEPLLNVVDKVAGY